MILVRKKILLILLILSSLIAGVWYVYSIKKLKLDARTIAIVNKEPISISVFETRLNNIKTNYQPEYAEAHTSIIKKNLLRKMVVESMLLQEADKKGISVSDKELQRYVRNLTYGYTKTELEQLLFNQFKTYDEWVQEIKTKLIIEKAMSKVILDKINISENSIKELYKEKFEGKTSQEKIKLAQIFTTSQEKIKQAAEELKTGIDFHEIAKKYSESPEATNGGILGFISKGEGIEIFDKGFELPEGQTSEVLSSDYGFHIIKVIKKIPPEEINYEKAKPFIIAELTRQEESKLYEKWLTEKMKKAKIQINKALLDSIK
jgi:peptidyl-prolyl cis-trans isomerase C